MYFYNYRKSISPNNFRSVISGSSNNLLVLLLKYLFLKNIPILLYILIGALDFNKLLPISKIIVNIFRGWENFDTVNGVRDYKKINCISPSGVQERAQLLRLNVPATFMLVALDEGPGPAIKYQYTELGKLNQLVSVLVRCCDVSSKCQSSTGGPVLPNPYRDPACSDYIMPLPPQACEVLFGRPR